MPVASTILTNLETQLRTVLTTGGYLSNVHLVTRDVAHFSRHMTPEGKVKVEIVHGGEERVLQRCPNNNILKVAAYLLRAVIKGPFGTTPPLDKANDWIGDLHKLIFAPISLGANVRYCDLIGIDEVAVDEHQAMVTARIEITYFFDHTAP